MATASLHHSFDVALASTYSIEEAILIHHFQHWIAINKRMGKNQIEGRTWTYQTQKYIAAHFPYFKNRLKILRLIDGLVKKKVLLEGSFNKKGFDRTKWYAFVDEDLYLAKVKYDPSLKEQDDENEQSSVQNRTMDGSEVNNGMFRTEPPIPDTKDIYLREEREAPPLKMEFGKVKLLKEEHQKLIEEFGDSLIETMIARLNEYAEIKPKMFKEYANHAMVIRKWIRMDNEAGKGSSGNDNKKLAQRIANKYVNKQCITLGADYLEFVLGPMNCVHIKFTDPAFKEITMNTLRKMGLSI
jgi:hypothetical protein